MSSDIDLLKVDKEGLFILGLPKSSEIIVRAMMLKTGNSSAEVISVAIQLLAGKILTKEDQTKLAEKIKNLD